MDNNTKEFCKGLLNLMEKHGCYLSNIDYNFIVTTAKGEEHVICDGSAYLGKSDLKEILEEN